MCLETHGAGLQRFFCPEEARHPLRSRSPFFRLFQSCEFNLRYSCERLHVDTLSSDPFEDQLSQTAPERGLAAIKIKSFHTSQYLFFFWEKAVIVFSKQTAHSQQGDKMQTHLHTRPRTCKHAHTHTSHTHIHTHQASATLAQCSKCQCDKLHTSAGTQGE